MSTILALLSPALACGPYFDHPRLSWVGRNMLDAPTSHFDADVRVLARTIEPPPGVHARLKSTATGDLEDIRAAMPEADVGVITDWKTAREDLDLTPYPDEFASYIRGVRAMQIGEMDEAAAQWRAVLDLPEDERQWRATWAAYMLPVTTADPNEQIAGYQQVLDLVAQGTPDPLGLAAASLRHRSGLHAGQEQWAASIRDCLMYRAAQGRKFCNGLADRAGSALASDDLTPLIEDPLVAELIGIYLTTGRADHADRWLEAVETAKTAVPGADRLAWASYQLGDFEAAARWAKRAEPDAPMGWWMTAKLALRAGDIDAAVTALEHTVALLPAPGDELFTDFPRETTCSHSNGPGQSARVELGIALVAADRPEDALTAFLSAGDWLDGAWVAERLMTTDALQSYVDHWFPTERRHQWPPHMAVVNLLDGEDLPTTQVPASMRHLLARRLAREERWREAVAYYPESTWQRQARDVANNLIIGHDTQQSDATRGAALWAAAWSWKMNGWALVATEMEPDFRVLEGWYESIDTTDLRLNPQTEYHSEEELLAHRTLAPTPAERDHLASSGPDQRYHFVWTAQETAWEAVQLLPGDHPDILEAGCIAGNWTRWRDPAAADRFWKLMYEKARHTPRGAVLFARQSWFGLLDDDGRCNLPEPTETSCATAPPGPFLLLLLPLVCWRRRSDPEERTRC